MRFNLISNIANGAGLERDYQLLRRLLERLGHAVCGVPYRSTTLPPAADVNVFLEVVTERFFKFAPRNWVVPNPEWWFSGWDPLLPRFDLVLAKTRHCEQLFSAKSECCRFIGWRSQDLMDAAVPRQRAFLHLAGKSQTKNTAAVVEAWRLCRPAADLTVVADWMPPKSNHRTRWVKRAEETELRELMNSHLFHLMPSAYEGWGHGLHEALGVGAVLLTTNAPPMNELAAPRELLIAPAGTHQQNAVPIHKVEAVSVFRAVGRALAASEEKLLVWREEARAGFEAEIIAWEKNIEALLA